MTVAWALPTDMVYGNIGCGGSLYIFAGKAHATDAACRHPQVVWKNTPHIPASSAVIPAQAGIQTFGFQKYSAITVAWALPTDMVNGNIGCGGSLNIFSRAKSTLRQPIADTCKSSEKTHSISLLAAPSFPRRRESRPLIFRNIQRLPQYGLCPRMRFAEILVLAGRLCFTG